MESEKKSLLSLKKSSSSSNILITAEVENKIRYMCSRIPTTEWSGVLFYTADKQLNIRCVDFLVMNIGSSGYTEFDVNPDIISYMTEKDLLDCYTGLIHSHHSMSTFFSQTDLATLLEEGNKQHHFVSLIVNNSGDYTAAITKKVNVTSIVKDTKIYESFNDEVIKEDDDYTEHSEYVEYSLLDIIKEGAYNYNFLDSRIKELEALKESNTTQKKPVTSTYKAWPLEYTKPIQAQPSLFDDELDNPIGVVDMNLVKSIILKLITGSIILTNDSKINPVKWVNTSMVKTFNKVFANMTEFESWIEYMGEFLFFSISFKNQVVIDTIYEELTKLPKNKYMNIIVKVVKEYTSYE